MLALNMILVDDTQKRDFEKLYDEFKNEAYHIAFRILGDRSMAEDSVADGFLSIARNFRKISCLESDKRHGYIVVTIQNAARMILRKNRHQFEELEYEDSEYVNESEISLYDPLWIKDCVRKLNKTDLEILYLKYVVCLEHGEIGLTLGISQEASRKRLQKAKQHLAALLKEGDGDE